MYVQSCCFLKLSKSSLYLLNLPNLSLVWKRPLSDWELVKISTIYERRSHHDMIYDQNLQLNSQTYPWMVNTQAKPRQSLQWRLFLFSGLSVPVIFCCLEIAIKKSSREGEVCCNRKKLKKMKSTLFSIKIVSVYITFEAYRYKLFAFGLPLLFH